MFGKMFEYSNSLAPGFIGGRVAFPTRELGAAYDEAMLTRVFRPLSLNGTTFDFTRALAANHAGAHAPDVDGKPARAVRPTTSDEAAGIRAVQGVPAATRSRREGRQTVPVAN